MTQVLRLLVRAFSTWRTGGGEWARAGDLQFWGVSVFLEVERALLEGPWGQKFTGGGLFFSFLPLAVDVSPY